MVNAQEWLESQAEYNTKEKREKVEELDISSKILEGELDLEDFIDLEELNCSKNQLTELNLSNCRSLKSLICNDNKISGLKLTGLNKLRYIDARYNELADLRSITDHLNPKKLEKIKLSDNNFHGEGSNDFVDLSAFEKFTNLELLWVGNYRRETSKKVYNRFNGSLNSLEKLTKLEDLEVGLTDIDSGEIPKRVKTFWCWNGKEWEGYGTPNNKAQELIKKLNLEDYAVEVGKKYNPRKKTKPVQDWLRELEKDKRSQKSLFVRSSHDLGGELVMDGNRFPELRNLERLYCYNNQLTKLELNNLPNLIEVQTWDNQLTDLKINNCPKIESLNVSSNYLTKLDFLKKLESSKLKVLDIANNNFIKKDIECFEKFTRLEKLYIGSWDREINKGSYNKFTGTLESLSSLKNLKHLGIENTDVNLGLEYLSESLEEIHCDTRGRKDAECKEIQKQLEQHSIPGKSYSYDFQSWRRNKKFDIRAEMKKIRKNQSELVEKMNKFSKNKEKREEFERNKTIFERISYVGDGLTVFGTSTAKSIVELVGYPEAGDTLTFACPLIGGGLSAGGKYLSSYYEKKEGELNKESSELSKVNMLDIWNKFLQGKEELERKWSSEEKKELDDYIKKLPQKEKVGEALSELLKATEDLPKSINSDEMQRMEKEAKEGLFQALWEYWKVDRLGEKVDRFLKVTEEEPHTVIENKLKTSLEELESIRSLYSSVNNEQRKKLKKLENKLKELIDGLQQNLSEEEIRININDPQEESSQQTDENTPLLKSQIGIPPKRSN